MNRDVSVGPSFADSHLTVLQTVSGKDNVFVLHNSGILLNIVKYCLKRCFIKDVQINQMLKNDQKDTSVLTNLTIFCVLFPQSPLKCHVQSLLPPSFSLHLLAQFHS